MKYSRILFTTHSSTPASYTNYKEQGRQGKGEKVTIYKTQQAEHGQD